MHPQKIIKCLSYSVFLSKGILAEENVNVYRNDLRLYFFISLTKYLIVLFKQFPGQISRDVVSFRPYLDGRQIFNSLLSQRELRDAKHLQHLIPLTLI